MLQKAKSSRRTPGGGDKAWASEAAVEGIKRQRQEVITLLRSLLVALKQGDTDTLLHLLLKLQEKTRSLLNVIEPSLVEEAFEFLDQIRVPQNPSRILTLATRTYSNHNISGYLSPETALDMELMSPDVPSVSAFNPECGLSDNRSTAKDDVMDMHESSIYRPTDEPEPWDLIQLNVQASIMCLTSKIKTYCNRMERRQKGGVGSDMERGSIGSESVCKDCKGRGTSGSVGCVCARRDSKGVDESPNDVSDNERDKTALDADTTTDETHTQGLISTSVGSDSSHASVSATRTNESQRSSCSATPDVSPCEEDSGIGLERVASETERGDCISEGGLSADEDRRDDLPLDRTEVVGDIRHDSLGKSGKLESIMEQSIEDLGACLEEDLKDTEGPEECVESLSPQQEGSEDTLVGNGSTGSDRMEVNQAVKSPKRMNGTQKSGTVLHKDRNTDDKETHVSRDTVLLSQTDSSGPQMFDIEVQSHKNQVEGSVIDSRTVTRKGIEHDAEIAVKEPRESIEVEQTNMSVSDKPGSRQELKATSPEKRPHEAHSHDETTRITNATRNTHTPQYVESCEEPKHNTNRKPEQANGGTKSSRETTNHTENEKPKPATNHKQEEGITEASQGVTSPVKKPQVTSEEVDWIAEVRPSMRKLRQAMDGLMRTARLVHSVFRLQQTPEAAQQAHDIKYRRDICFSQALTSLVTALMTRLWCRKADPLFVTVLAHLGPLAEFECLVSCHGDEEGQLGDMVVAVEDLGAVEFVMVSVPASQSGGRTRSEGAAPPQVSYELPMPHVSGNRSGLRVVLPVPEHVYSLLPNTNTQQPDDPPTFCVTPVLFNIGINEEATLAEKLGTDSPQTRNNQDSYERLSQYYHRFKKLPLPQESCRRVPSMGSEVPLVDLIDKLGVEVVSSRSKNPSVLYLAAQCCRAMAGLRFTSCKSGKDRTGVSATLEQATILAAEYDLAETEFQRALNCMRSEGTRLENCYKNIGSRRYAFSALQLTLFPKQYRPPSGTYGSNVT